MTESAIGSSREMRGNPLALLELPQGMTATELAGGFGLLGAQDLSGRIEKSFVRQLELLPVEARRFLLLAAAEPSAIRCCSGARPRDSASARRPPMTWRPAGC